MRLFIIALLFAISYAQTDSWKEVEVEAVGSEVAVVPYAEFSNPENIVGPPAYRRSLGDMLMNHEIRLGEILSEEEVGSIKLRWEKYRTNEQRRRAARMARLKALASKCTGCLKKAWASIRSKASVWLKWLLKKLKDYFENFTRKFKDNFEMLGKNLKDAKSKVWDFVSKVKAKTETDGFAEDLKAQEEAYGAHATEDWQMSAKTSDKAKSLEPAINKLGALLGFSPDVLNGKIAIGFSLGASVGAIVSAGFTANYFIGWDGTENKLAAAAVGTLSIGAGIQIQGTVDWTLTFCWNTSPYETEGFGINLDFAGSFGIGGKFTLGWAWDPEKLVMKLSCIGFTLQHGGGGGIVLSAAYSQATFGVSVGEGVKGFEDKAPLPAVDAPTKEEKDYWQSCITLSTASFKTAGIGEETEKVEFDEADKTDPDAPKDDSIFYSLYATEAEAAQHLVVPDDITAEDVAKWDQEYDTEVRAARSMTMEWDEGGDSTVDDAGDKMARTKGKDPAEVTEKLKGGKKTEAQVSNQESHSINHQEELVSQGAPPESFVSQATSTKSEKFSDFIIQVTFAGSALVALLLTGSALSSSNSEEKSLSYTLIEQSTLEV